MSTSISPSSPPASAGAAGAAGGARAVGWMASAGAVAGPAAAALFLNPSDMEQSSQTDAERIAQKRWGAALNVLGLGLGKGSALPQVDPLLFAENRSGERAVIESFARIGDAVAVARAGGAQPFVRQSVQQVAVKLTIDGPGAGMVRATEVEGAGKVEKKVGVRSAGSGLP